MELRINNVIPNDIKLNNITISKIMLNSGIVWGGQATPIDHTFTLIRRWATAYNMCGLSEGIIYLNDGTTVDAPYTTSNTSCTLAEDGLYHQEIILAKSDGTNHGTLEISTPCSSYSTSYYHGGEFPLTNNIPYNIHFSAFICTTADKEYTVRYFTESPTVKAVSFCIYEKYDSSRNASYWKCHTNNSVYLDIDNTVDPSAVLKVIDGITYCMCFVLYRGGVTLTWRRTLPGQGAANNVYYPELYLIHPLTQEVVEHTLDEIIAINSQDGYDTLALDKKTFTMTLGNTYGSTDDLVGINKIILYDNLFNKVNFTTNNYQDYHIASSVLAYMDTDIPIFSNATIDDTLIDNYSFKGTLAKDTTGNVNLNYGNLYQDKYLQYLVTGFRCLSSGSTAETPEIYLTQDETNNLPYIFINQVSVGVNICTNFRIYLKDGTLLKPLYCNTTYNYATINGERIEKYEMVFTKDPNASGKVIATAGNLDTSDTNQVKINVYTSIRYYSDTYGYFRCFYQGDSYADSKYYGGMNIKDGHVWFCFEENGNIIANDIAYFLVNNWIKNYTYTQYGFSSMSVKTIIDTMYNAGDTTELTANTDDIKMIIPDLPITSSNINTSMVKYNNNTIFEYQDETSYDAGETKILQEVKDSPTMNELYTLNKDEYNSIPYIAMKFTQPTNCSLNNFRIYLKDGTLLKPLYCNTTTGYRTHENGETIEKHVVVLTKDQTVNGLTVPTTGDYDPTDTNQVQLIMYSSPQYSASYALKYMFYQGSYYTKGSVYADFVYNSKNMLWICFTETGNISITDIDYITIDNYISSSYNYNSYGFQAVNYWCISSNNKLIYNNTLTFTSNTTAKITGLKIEELTTIITTKYYAKYIIDIINNKHYKLWTKLEAINNPTGYILNTTDNNMKLVNVKTIVEENITTGESDTIESSGDMITRFGITWTNSGYASYGPGFGRILPVADGCAMKLTKVNATTTQSSGTDYVICKKDVDVSSSENLATYLADRSNATTAVYTTGNNITADTEVESDEILIKCEFSGKYNNAAYYQVFYPLQTFNRTGAYNYYMCSGASGYIKYEILKVGNGITSIDKLLVEPNHTGQGNRVGFSNVISVTSLLLNNETFNINATKAADLPVGTTWVLDTVNNSLEKIIT